MTGRWFVWIFLIEVLASPFLWAGEDGCCVDGHSLITTVAGSGLPGYSGDGSPATDARFAQSKDGISVLYWECSLSGLWVDEKDDLYICDGWNHVVRKVSPDGIITTWAGTGSAGFDGDGGPATKAQLNKPTNVVEDAKGNFYICDEGNQRIRKVDPQGIITTVVGNGDIKYAGDGGPATLASLNYPYGLAVEPDGTLYIADSHNHAVRKVSTKGIITTIVGDGTAGFDGDGGPAVKAHTNLPEAIALDPEGNIYFNDDAAAEYVKPGGRLRKVDEKGIITRIAGTGGHNYDGDEIPASEAQIADLHGLAFCGGNIYLSDVGSSRVRMIDPQGIIHTIAGDGLKRRSGDRGPANMASIHEPGSLVMDRHGNLYVAEDEEHVVRKITNIGCTPLPTQPVRSGVTASAVTQVSMVNSGVSSSNAEPSPTISPTVSSQPRPVVSVPMRPTSTSVGGRSWLTPTPTVRVPRKLSLPTPVWTSTRTATVVWVTPTPTPYRHPRPLAHKTPVRTATLTPMGEKPWVTPTPVPTHKPHRKGRVKPKAVKSPTPVGTSPAFTGVTAKGVRPSPRGARHSAQMVKKNGKSLAQSTVVTVKKKLLLITPTRTPTLMIRKKTSPTFTPTRVPVKEAIRSSDAAPTTISYRQPPANIFLSFEDGPGLYSLEIVDAQGSHLRDVFQQRVLEDKGQWADWDGKDEDGHLLPPGHYFAVFSKDGVVLKRISVVRESGEE